VARLTTYDQSSDTLEKPGASLGRELMPKNCELVFNGWRKAKVATKF
jgi:hypothetical protein